VKRLYVILAVLIPVAAIVWYAAKQHPKPSPQPAAVTTNQPVQKTGDASPTQMYAHNLLLRKGPDFRIYIPWISGQLVRTKKDTVPSFDDQESFFLEVQRGIIHANLGDLSHFMNSGAAPTAPLQNISIAGNGNHISLHGTIHKMHVPLPIGLDGTVSPSPDGRIHLHVDRLSVLKLPVKGLLGNLNVSIQDLMGNTTVPGIEAAQNDLYLDTQTLLPAPHIHGVLTSVRIVNPDIEVVYGAAQNDIARTEEWHNFLALKGGTLDFGKLTMRHVDLIMIDAGKDPWFDLDLVNYQAQLVNGYTRMTPQAGLQIFMPDLDQLSRQHGPQTITAQWLKDRNLPPPPVSPTK
jgi:hypothetical protein